MSRKLLLAISCFSLLWMATETSAQIIRPAQEPQANPPQSLPPAEAEVVPASPLKGAAPSKLSEFAPDRWVQNAGGVEGDGLPAGRPENVPNSNALTLLPLPQAGSPNEVLNTAGAIEVPSHPQVVAAGGQTAGSGVESRLSDIEPSSEAGSAEMPQANLMVPTFPNNAGSESEAALPEGSQSLSQSAPNNSSPQVPTEAAWGQSILAADEGDAGDRYAARTLDQPNGYSWGNAAPTSDPWAAGPSARGWLLSGNRNQDAYPIPMNAGPQTAPGPQDYFDNDDLSDAPAVGPTSVVTGCPGCGDPNCNGACGYGTGCQSCGPGGCYDANAVDARFGCSGSVSCARHYAQFDILYWNFENSGIMGTNAGGLGDYDSDFGWRFNFGRRWDATAGFEFGYMGTTEFSNQRELNDPGFRLAADFGIGIPYFPSDVSSFFNATQQIESRESQLHSFEFNRCKWGWDVLKTFWGFRAIYWDDQYQLFSNNGVTSGTLDLEAKNFLVGLHVGKELFYDVGYRVSYSCVLKGGLYANLTELDTRVVNGANVLLDRSTDGSTFSQNLEVGFNGFYQLTTHSRLRFGYDFMWMWGLASVNENYPVILDSDTGTAILDDDEIFYHGVTFGFELFR